MAKVRVPVSGTVGKSVLIEANAVTQEQLTAAIAAIQPTQVATSGLASTVWKLIREIPLNIRNLASLATAGLIVRKSDSSMVARTITGTAGRVVITNGSGSAGNPTIDMDDVSAVSAWGRSANSSGKPAAIAAAADDTVLRRTGSALDFGTLTLAMANNALWTYAKLQAVTATSRVLGRKTAGAGTIEELTLSDILDFVGSAAQGDILYRGSAGWVRLAAGTSGKFLKTQGAAADPMWDTPSGGGGSGAYTFVNSAVIAGAAATNLTISSLDLDADEEYVVRLEILNATAATPNISMFYNADTTAGNYDSQGTSFDGAGTTSARANTAVIGGLSASTSATFEIWLRRNLSAKVMAHAQVIRGTTTTMFAQSFSTQWRTASTNVTGITINSSTASALAIGSKITVWKRRAV